MSMKKVSGEHSNDCFDELAKAAKPLQQFLKDHYNLMCVAVVEISGVRVLSIEMGTSSEELLDD